VAGYRYRLDSATMTAIQTPLPKQRTFTGTRPTPPTNPNVTTTTLTPQPVNGVSATGTTTTLTIPAGAVGNAQAITVTRTVWTSTALQIPVEIKTSDPRFGSTDMELTNVSLAEPSSTMFVVPSGYTIKTGGPGASGPAGRMRGPGGPRF
jgi:heme-binding NEAT domain protein